ncbi:MAG: proline dehydrogenase [Sphingobacteriaceae bacterium]|jgi:proline dehydrogenase|nr:proline dehydrogenase [Sphingobacteriaceae bacterium]
MATTSPGSSHPENQSLSFENTEIAFKGKSNKDLNKAYWLFKVIGSSVLTRVGPPLTNLAFKLGLPIDGAIKSTIFRQFCGGESIGECEAAIEQLARGGVGTILDYSVEGGDEESTFLATSQEIIRTIERAKGDCRIPFSVFKPTGVGRAGLLAKLDAGGELSHKEQAEYVKFKGRVDMICQAAVAADVPVMMDAEESWIQDTIDKLSLEMMRRYNREKAIVYNTYQLYRHDKLASLKSDAAFAESNGFMLGAKLVRGAYMEKERERAAELGYASPIQADKAATDRDYNAALEVCIKNIKYTALVAGTHNENSCKALVDLLSTNKIPHNHPHVFFSQLLGMSDNLSFNLASAGYNVVKYVPYGPVKSVMPYLFRRAQENTSIAGQTGRELSLIITEKRRRKA